MSSLRTTYEFTLPRGYVDDEGTLHRKGVMRLATARDELAPLRDPTVQGPDDPRLTILVLTRVVTRLGSLEQINSYVIEGLFAVDLAFLQDFYGVINFGNQEEFDALIAAQESSALVGSSAPAPSPAPAAAPAAEGAGAEPADDAPTSAAPAGGSTGVSEQLTERPSLRHSVEELPRRSS